MQDVYWDERHGAMRRKLISPPTYWVGYDLTDGYRYIGRMQGVMPGARLEVRAKGTRQPTTFTVVDAIAEEAIIEADVIHRGECARLEAQNLRRFTVVPHKAPHSTDQVVEPMGSRIGLSVATAAVVEEMKEMISGGDGGHAAEPCEATCYMDNVVHVKFRNNKEDHAKAA